MLPALPGPMTTSEPENDEQGEPQTESGQTEGGENTEAGAEADAGPDTDSGGVSGETVNVESEAEGGEEKVTPEDGHVDNVGDESEKETVLP